MDGAGVVAAECVFELDAGGFVLSFVDQGHAEGEMGVGIGPGVFDSSGVEVGLHGFGAFGGA